MNNRCSRRCAIGWSRVIPPGCAPSNERLGLPCGGRLVVLVEPCTRGAHLEHVEHLLEALAQRRCAQREVRIESGACQWREVARMSVLALDNGILRHTLGPRYRLLLVGAGQLSQSVALLAIMLDYRVSVCDPRFTAIITLTHDPRIDDMALMEALGLDAFYIGALGSQRTSARRRERLRELDLDEQQIARLHAPVGLDIGSKRPMEIAIAILAELIALRRGQS